MTCACIEEFDRKLAPHNTRIAPALLRFGDGSWETRPVIVGEQIERGRGKKKAVTIAPTFCPFCGIRYEPEPAVPATEQADG